MTIPWLILTISTLIIILAIVMVTKTGKEGRKSPDYYAFFMIGLVWLIFGIIMALIGRSNSVGNIFTILGLIYFAIGLTHKKDWKKNRQKAFVQNGVGKWIILILLVIFVTGISAYLLTSGIL